MVGGDQDGVSGGSMTVLMTVSDTAFAVGGLDSGSDQRNIAVQNLSSVTLTLTNVGTKQHGFVVHCIRSGVEVGSEVRQFKHLVKTLHRSGIEVILDVVYNHTAEGNHLGPTFNLKGIDNATYYRLVADEPRFYFDTTGTGITLNVRSPQVLALIMDSLHYWASEMHVDGFRFDLAAALARQLYDVDQLSSFFTLIHQSPTLSRMKLIAEPWDVDSNGYQVGNFPVRWAEWNGRYRDAVRAFWRGDVGYLGEIGYRLAGSNSCPSVTCIGPIEIPKSSTFILTVPSSPRARIRFSGLISR